MESNLLVSQYFKVLKHIFFSLFFGQIAFAVMAIVANMGVTKDIENLDFVHIAQYFIPSFTVSTIIVSRWIFKLIIKSSSQYEIPLLFKRYQVASIVRWGIMESGVLLSLVLYFISMDPVFLGYALMGLFFFYKTQPSAEIMLLDFNSSSELSKVIDSNEVPQSV